MRYLLFIVVLILAGCENYDYVPPEQPLLFGLVRGEEIPIAQADSVDYFAETVTYWNSPYGECDMFSVVDKKIGKELLTMQAVQGSIIDLYLVGNSLYVVSLPTAIDAIRLFSPDGYEVEASIEVVDLIAIKKKTIGIYRYQLDTPNFFCLSHMDNGKIFIFSPVGAYWHDTVTGQSYSNEYKVDVAMPPWVHKDKKVLRSPSNSNIFYFFGLSDDRERTYIYTFDQEKMNIISWSEMTMQFVVGVCAKDGVDYLIGHDVYHSNDGDSTSVLEMDLSVSVSVTNELFSFEGLHNQPDLSSDGILYFPVGQKVFAVDAKKIYAPPSGGAADWFDQFEAAHDFSSVLHGTEELEELKFIRGGKNYLLRSNERLFLVRTADDKVLSTLEDVFRPIVINREESLVILSNGDYNMDYPYKKWFEIPYEK